MSSLNADVLKDYLACGKWEKLAQAMHFPDCYAMPIPSQAYHCWSIPVDCLPHIERLTLLSTTPGFRLLLVEAQTLPHGLLRQMMRSVQRMNPAEKIVWWVATGDDLTISLLDRDANGREFIRRLTTSRHAPTPFCIQQWLSMSLAHCVASASEDVASVIQEHLRDILCQDILTRQFFRAFSDALTILIKGMDNGPDDPRDKHDIALITLLRITFIYFLQQKEALGGDRRFMIRHLRQVESRGDNYYAVILRPLFFGVLNAPVESRDALVKGLDALNKIPFLNGGLFEPIPAENEAPELGWDNLIWHQIITELFERYQFASDTTENSDEVLAIDPEMLGKVFEGLMYGDARKNSGSFYTPRDIVQQMVGEVFASYLQDKTGGMIDAQRLTEWLEGDEDLDCTALQKCLKNAISTITVLDPAVGTGAFLLEAFNTLSRYYRRLGIMGDCVNQYAQGRHIIHTHLFGVDIHPTAVRLCELRLWLKLLELWPQENISEIAPLPNLSHRISSGDSLVDPGELMHRNLLPCKKASAKTTKGTDIVRWIPPHFYADYRAEIDALNAVQVAYLTAHGESKLALQTMIAQRQTMIQQKILAARAHYIKEQQEPLLKLQSSNDLLGNRVQLSAAQQMQLGQLEDALDATNKAIEDHIKARKQSLAFSYNTHFAMVMARGGFDIIVTNPPWVREQNIDRTTRDFLKRRYVSYHSALWPQAKQLGIRQPYGSQVDMASLFIERSLELLKSGGYLCALIPAKIFRSLHGASLRKLLSTQTILHIEDYSDSARQIFDATTYPAVLRLRKTGTHVVAKNPRKASKSISMSIWRGKNKSQWQVPLDELCGNDISNSGQPWLFVEPEIRQIFNKIYRQSHCLGQSSRFEPRRGIFTGANDLFIMPEAELWERFGNEGLAWSRAVLQGRGIQSGELICTDRIVWAYDNQGQCLPEIPACLEDYFEQHRSRLMNRGDFQSKYPLWQIFRAHAELHCYKVVWRDIGTHLEATVAGPQIIPLNTVYFIACATEGEAHAIAALLNSEPLRAIAFALAERARGGWRRHFSWVIRMLPIPMHYGLLEHDICIDAAENPFSLSNDELELLNMWRVQGLKQPVRNQQVTAQFDNVGISS